MLHSPLDWLSLSELLCSLLSTHISTIASEHMEDQRKLVEYVKESLDSEEDFHFLRFEGLQRLNISRFEAELAHTKSQMKRGETVDLVDLSRTLHDYSESSMNYSHTMSSINVHTYLKPTPFATTLISGAKGVWI